MAWSPRQVSFVSPPVLQPGVIRLPVPRYAPFWTFVLLGINVLVWLLMTVAGGSTDPLILIKFGAKYNPLIIAGQYWRLLTANFLHVGALHLAFNSYALLIFGPEVETRFGRLRFLIIYVLSGIGGTVLSFLGNTAISAGASAAIFGLLGATIAYFARYRQEFGEGARRRLSNLAFVATYNLFWGFVQPGIDNLGHIGGLMTGLVLGWELCPRYRIVVGQLTGIARLVDRLPSRRIASSTFWVSTVLVLLAYLGVRVQT